MKIALVDRIIRQEVAGRSLVTAIWLVSVYLFLAFLELAEDANLENQFALIIQILVLSIPKMIYELSPMIFLIGAMLALMTLSRSFELLAMQAGGISKKRITGSIVGTSLVFAVTGSCLGRIDCPFLRVIKVVTDSARKRVRVITCFQYCDLDSRRQQVHVCRREL